MQDFFIIFIFASLLGGMLTGSLIERLKTQHTLMWETLGKPRSYFFLFTKRDTAGRASLMRFLWQGDYLVLEDRSLTLFGRFIRIYSAAYVALLLAFFIKLIGMP